MGACRDRYAIAWVGVDEGVADKVAEDLGDPVGVGLERPVDGLEVEVALAEQGKVTAEVFEEVAELDCAWLDQLTALGAGEREHVADEPVELVKAPEQCRRCLVPAALVGFAVEQLDLGPQHSKGCAEFVGFVRDEVALALECALEPVSMSSNASESTPTSPRPPIPPVRFDSSPASTAVATRAMRRSGAAIRLARPIPAAIAASSAIAPTITNVRRRLACACSTG